MLGDDACYAAFSIAGTTRQMIFQSSVIPTTCNYAALDLPGWTKTHGFGRWWELYMVFWE